MARRRKSDGVKFDALLERSKKPILPDVSTEAADGTSAAAALASAPAASVSPVPATPAPAPSEVPVPSAVPVKSKPPPLPPPKTKPELPAREIAETVRMEHPPIISLDDRDKTVETVAPPPTSAGREDLDDIPLVDIDEHSRMELLEEVEGEPSATSTPAHAGDDTKTILGMGSMEPPARPPEPEELADMEDEEEENTAPSSPPVSAAPESGTADDTLRDLHRPTAEEMAGAEGLMGASPEDLAASVIASAGPDPVADDPGATAHGFEPAPHVAPPAPVEVPVSAPTSAPATTAAPTGPAVAMGPELVQAKRRKDEIERVVTIVPNYNQFASASAEVRMGIGMGFYVRAKPMYGGNAAQVVVEQEGVGAAGIAEVKEHVANNASMTYPMEVKHNDRRLSCGEGFKVYLMTQGDGSIRASVEGLPAGYREIADRVERDLTEHETLRAVKTDENVRVYGLSSEEGVHTPVNGKLSIMNSGGTYWVYGMEKGKRTPMRDEKGEYLTMEFADDSPNSRVVKLKMGKNELNAVASKEGNRVYLYVSGMSKERVSIAAAKDLLSGARSKAGGASTKFADFLRDNWGKLSLTLGAALGVGGGATAATIYVPMAQSFGGKLAVISGAVLILAATVAKIFERKDD